VLVRAKSKAAGPPRFALAAGGAVTSALAARLAPQCPQKRLSTATSVPHSAQRVNGMGMDAPEFYKKGFAPLAKTASTL
jgi:hypothetical protein